MQTSLLGFQRQASGLLAPSPGGLPGLQRQTMAQTKKGGTVWMDYAQYRDVQTTGPNGYNAPLWDGTIMRWMDSAFAAPLAEYSVGGPLWAIHLLPNAGTPNGGAKTNERGVSSTNSIPLTNSVTDCYLHIIWPTRRTAISWRAHNLGGDWAIDRVPGAGSLLQGKRASDGAWVTLDSGFGAITNLIGDTGNRTILPASRILCSEHRLYCADGGTNSAQSLCFLDIKFA